jgi:hypothetical protein
MMVVRVIVEGHYPDVKHLNEAAFRDQVARALNSGDMLPFHPPVTIVVKGFNAVMASEREMGKDEKTQFEA